MCELVLLTFQGHRSYIYKPRASLAEKGDTMADEDKGQAQPKPSQKSEEAVSNVSKQSNLELVKFFLEFRRQHNWFWPCTCYPDDDTFDSVSLRVYAVDILHGLARLMFMVMLIVHYLGDLEEHNIQPILNQTGLTEPQVPNLKGHQWAQQLYADTTTWLQQPIRDALLHWTLMEYIALWLKHMGNFLMLRRLKLRLNELQLTGKLNSQEEFKGDEETQAAQVDKKSLADEIDGPPSFAVRYLQHMEDRVDLPAGGSLHNTADGKSVQNIFSVTKELLKGETREQTLEGEEMQQKRSSVANDTDGLISKLLFALLLYMLLYVLIPFGCGWFGNLRLLIASTDNDSAAQMTAVSLLLAAMLPLLSMEFIMRLISALMFNLCGCMAQVRKTQMTWSVVWVLEAASALVALGLIWYVDGWVDTQNRRDPELYTNQEAWFLLAMALLIIAMVCNIMHLFNMHNKCRYHTQGLHPMLKVEHGFNAVWQLALFVACMFLLHGQTGKDYGPATQCDPECIAPSMAWFNRRGMLEYNQTYLGPVEFSSTNTYNATMQECWDSGSHIPSLGEHCKSSKLVWDLLAAFLGLSGVSTLIFEALLNYRSLSWSKGIEKLERDAREKV